VTFDCPRCARPTDDRFYGPCGDCRAQLGVMMARAADAGEVVDAVYEPKMNVVPNQVATKE
jgi:hypothetical protein